MSPSGRPSSLKARALFRLPYLRANAALATAAIHLFVPWQLATKKVQTTALWSKVSLSHHQLREEEVIRSLWICELVEELTLKSR
eukprot:scaffold161093_cov49-Attheya_sp.AAC.1